MRKIRVFLVVLFMFAGVMIGGRFVAVPVQAAVSENAVTRLSESPVIIMKGQMKRLSVPGKHHRVGIWTSSDERVVTVSANGWITARRKGRAFVTYQTNHKKYRCKVIVRFLELSAKHQNLSVGETFKLRLKGAKKTATWNSTNTNVATVTEKGKVKAKAAGTCTIVATAMGRKYRCTINVEEDSNHLRILMLGNSFTRKNDMPSMLAKLTGATVECNVRSGERLASHLNSGTKVGAKTLAALQNEKWDYVVLQEKSSLPATSQFEFDNSVMQLCSKIREAGAIPVLYSTWAYKKGSRRLAKTGLSYEEMYRQTRDAYYEAAAQNNALIADVGAVFYKRSRWENLYARDGFHPNREGSRLAASTLAKVILNDAGKSGNDNTDE